MVDYPARDAAETEFYMCGICGLILRDSSASVEPSVIERMTGTMLHRGPDDSGTYVAGRVGLGMRRLSILDLACGQQPMHNEDRSLWIVFNGEIYNFIQLRDELASRGHAFKTASDTEVIVHAYEEFGTGCFNRLRGMFACALWDGREGALVLATDRFGIKPLYYALDRERIVFGSELKALLASQMVDREVDFEALGQYFTFGYISAPLSIFSGTQKLPAGHWLRWSPGREAIVRSYWDWPMAPLPNRSSPARIRLELRQFLRDAVRSHLVSDVPLGAFLSGGIDSSTVVALMSEVSAQPVETFSIGFREREFSELDKARTVARQFGTHHHEMVVEPEAVDSLPRIVAHFDEPFADTSALPTYYLSKMARQFVKVALSGDGGDELFLGYTVFQGVELSRYAQWLPTPLRLAPAALIGMLPKSGNPHWDDRVAAWHRRASETAMPPPVAYRSKMSPIGLSRSLPLLSKDLRQHLAIYDPFRLMSEALTRGSDGKGEHPLERYIYAGIKIGLAGDMLVKIDRMSMANSLEVRVPFLDHALAEFAATIPVSQRFPRWRLKGLLKDTMSDLLPGEILRRPKRGFIVPLSAWFRGRLTEYAMDTLLDPSERRRGFLNQAEIARAMKSLREREANLSPTLWSLLVFQLWCQQVLQ